MRYLALTLHKNDMSRSGSSAVAFPPHAMTNLSAVGLSTHEVSKRTLLVHSNSSSRPPFFFSPTSHPSSACTCYHLLRLPPRAEFTVASPSRSARHGLASLCVLTAPPLATLSSLVLCLTTAPLDIFNPFIARPSTQFVHLTSSSRPTNDPFILSLDLRASSPFRLAPVQIHSPPPFLAPLAPRHLPSFGVVGFDSPASLLYYLLHHTPRSLTTLLTCQGEDTDGLTEPKVPDEYQGSVMVIDMLATVPEKVRGSNKGNSSHASTSSPPNNLITVNDKAVRHRMLTPNPKHLITGNDEVARQRRGMRCVIL
ncbi:hypothetical protein B0H13DRAFT_2336559 [Mycena leptocephala]|nr:hypothetical protein B0H13DRAFT_2336559 [Mycena leptocephala]